METKNFENHSDESKVELTKESNEVKKTIKKKRSESPYLKIRSKANNIFRNQIDKSVETKRKAFDRAFNKVVSGDYTLERFLSEFKSNVDLLLDSKRFDKDCEIHNLKPFNAATHIAFDGASKIKLVRDNGLFFIYSNRLTELVEPIFTEEELCKASKVEGEAKPTE